jgi:hypothetical protein
VTRRRSPWTERMYDVLSDEDWHNMNDLITEMAKEIEPGRASRTVRDPAAQAGPARAVRVRTADSQTAVLAGKRRLARNTIRASAKAGLLDIDVSSGNEAQFRVRLSERMRQWDTSKLARHLGRSQSTIQAWFSDPELVAKVQAELPDGVAAINPDPFGGRRRSTPAAAVPAWESVANSRRVLLQTPIGQNEYEQTLALVLRRALDLPEHAAEKAARRLQEELRAADLGIYRRRQRNASS